MSLLTWLRSRHYPEDLYLDAHQVCRGVANTSSVFADPPATPHRPDASELLPTRPGGVESSRGGVVSPPRPAPAGLVCQIEGCDSSAGYLVARGAWRKTVCRECFEEMTAVLGWTLEGRISPESLMGSDLPPREPGTVALEDLDEFGGGL